MFDVEFFDRDWVSHLSRTYLIDETLVLRLLEEFEEKTSRTVEQFVSEHHLKLQEAGWKNQRIYDWLDRALRRGRFRASEKTTRQIRRMIYG